MLCLPGKQQQLGNAILYLGLVICFYLPVKKQVYFMYQLGNGTFY